MASEAGKGSRRRQPQVSQKEVDDNWDRIFKKELNESIKDNEVLYKKLSRIDTIGQNGNEGIHYDSDDIVEDRWSAVLRDEYDSKYWKDQ